VDANWPAFGFSAAPSFSKSCEDFDTFVEKLMEAGAEPEFFDDEIDDCLDSIYVHDPVLSIGSALVFGRMGKSLRKNEPASIETFCRRRNWPILGRIEPPGTLEGGDVLWLDEQTLAVGVGYRTNLVGIAQLRTITEGIVDNVVPVPLPHYRGPDDVLHLMSLISPVGPLRAVVYRPLLPVPFLQGLEASGFELIDVPDGEFDSLGCNVLSLSPGRVLAADGNPITRRRMEQAGIEVTTYPPGEISQKGQGGPTCLTRPLVRL